MERQVTSISPGHVDLQSGEWVLRHFYLLEHRMEGLHEVDKGETARGL